MAVTYVGVTGSTKYKGQYHLELVVTPIANTNSASITVYFVREFATGTMYWNKAYDHYIYLWYMGKNETAVTQHTISLSGTRIQTPAKDSYPIYTATIEFNSKVNVAAVSASNIIISAQYYATNVNTTGEWYAFSSPTDTAGNIIVPPTPTSNVYVYNNGWHLATAVYVYNGGWKRATNDKIKVYNGSWRS